MSTITIWSDTDAEESLNLPKDVAPYSDKGMELFQKWCVDTNTYYYARPSEDFFFSEAMILAQQAGATYLYAEDMS